MQRLFMNRCFNYCRCFDVVAMGIINRGRGNMSNAKFTTDEELRLRLANYTFKYRDELR